MKKVIFCLLTISALNAEAQDSVTPDIIVDEFFKRIMEDSVTQAIDYIFSINKLPSISESQIESLKVQLESTHKAIAPLYGQNQIVVRKLSDALVLFSYLMKYEVQPIRFNFIFYNADQNWRLQKFWYDDDVLDELSSATNLNRQKILTN